MDILIKGMEMPKRGIVVNIYADGRVTNHFDEFGKMIGKAVPVPAHGDLMDRNALDVICYCDIPQGCEDAFDSGVMWLAERIDELPTIIPASEEGET